MQRVCKGDTFVRIHLGRGLKETRDVVASRLLHKGCLQRCLCRQQNGDSGQWTVVSVTGDAAVTGRS